MTGDGRRRPDIGSIRQDSTVTSSRCIFCAIVAGKAEASVVHRDELVTAFMDVYPVNSGHTLVVPNHHSEGLEGVEEEVGGRIWAVAR